MFPTHDSLRDLEGILEDSRDLGQFLGSRVFVTSKGSRIPPLEVEREWMISSESALGQCHLVGHEGPSFGEISSVREGRGEI